MICQHALRSLNFKAAHAQLSKLFMGAKEVHTEKWQGIDISLMPAGRMLELMNVSLHVPRVPSTLERLSYDLEGIVNLPWAEDHFAERVCGYPINPGVEWANWPDGKSAAKFLDENGMFNHNYMQRYWPKHAGELETATGTVEDYEAQLVGAQTRVNRGIRSPYGDLDDIVSLLATEPQTRQAYLPIYFPEDTGGVGRKPCTLGYQFMMRENQLHIYYPMRSCDFYRHWGDDCYLTIRLGMWILERLKSIDRETWEKVEMGSFTMHCSSLHMFYNDYLSMTKKGTK